VQSERIERERVERSGRTCDGARGTLEARKDGGTDEDRETWSTLREREMDRAGRERRRWMLAREGSSPTSSSSSSSSSFSSSPSGSLLCARGGGWALLSDRASYPILSSSAILS